VVWWQSGHIYLSHQKNSTVLFDDFCAFYKTKKTVKSKKAKDNPFFYCPVILLFQVIFTFLRLWKMWFLWKVGMSFRKGDKRHVRDTEKCHFKVVLHFQKGCKKTQKVAKKTRKKVDILGLITNLPCYANITKDYLMSSYIGSNNSPSLDDSPALSARSTSCIKLCPTLCLLPSYTFQASW
jgi:hypothetical protein